MADDPPPPTGEAILQGRSPCQRPRGSTSGVVGGLTVVNALATASGLITGPLQARALGPEGRGALAAILVPLSLAPYLAGLGLTAYATRESARGRPVGAILGSLGALALVVGAVIVALASPGAALFAGGRETVYTYLLVGFLTLPLGLLGHLLLAVNSGVDRWRAVIAARLVPSLGGLAAIVILYAADQLTVATASLAVIVLGLVSFVPLLGVLRHGGRLRVSVRMARAAVPFGLKSWLGGLGSLANARLDQLLMIRLVDERELGLYAVAVTLASFSGILTGAVGTVLYTRVAAGEPQLVARALRVTLGVVVLTSALLAAAAPVTLRALFGEPFSSAAPMVWILLLAGIPLAGVTLLTAALTGGGTPGTPAVGELLALVITAIGLLALLPTLGAIGAAIVSAAAYSCSFGFLLLRATRRFQGRLTDFVLLRRCDLAWSAALVRARLRAGA